MALWQFVLDLVPASAARIAGVTAARMSRDQLDAINLNFPSAETESLLAQLGTLMPEKPSWSPNLRIWGDEETDDIQVWRDGRAIENVQFRLNVANLSLPLVAGICKVSRNFGCLLATSEGALLQPSSEAVVRAIMRSRAVEFVRDPKSYLEQALRLDRGET